MADDGEDESLIRIVISTDNHLGYKERDPIRSMDSFAAFEEVRLLDTCSLCCGPHQRLSLQFTIFPSLRIPPILPACLPLPAPRCSRPPGAGLRQEQRGGHAAPGRRHLPREQADAQDDAPDV